MIMTNYKKCIWHTDVRIIIVIMAIPMTTIIIIIYQTVLFFFFFCFIFFVSYGKRRKSVTFIIIIIIVLWAKSSSFSHTYSCIEFRIFQPYLLHTLSYSIFLSISTQCEWNSISSIVPFSFLFFFFYFLLCSSFFLWASCWLIQSHWHLFKTFHNIAWAHDEHYTV